MVFPWSSEEAIPYGVTLLSGSITTDIHSKFQILRRNMESVVEGLLDAPKGEGVRREFPDHS